MAHRAHTAAPTAPGPLDPALVEPAYELQKHLGFRMTGWSPDYAAFEMPLAPFHMNRYGIPHGGVYMTLLDTVMGYCGCYTGEPDAPRFAMTLTLTTNFVGRPQGAVLKAEARRIGGGKRTFFAEGLLTDDRGTTVATASGAFRYRSGG